MAGALVNDLEWLRGSAFAGAGHKRVVLRNNPFVVRFGLQPDGFAEGNLVLILPVVDVDAAAVADETDGVRAAARKRKSFRAFNRGPGLAAAGVGHFHLRIAFAVNDKMEFAVFVDAGDAHLQMNLAALNRKFLPLEPFARLNPADVPAAADVSGRLDGDVAVAIKIGLAVAARRAAVAVAVFHFHFQFRREREIALFAQDIDALVGIIVKSLIVAQRIALRIEIARGEQRGIFRAIGETFHERDQRAVAASVGEIAGEKPSVIRVFEAGIGGGPVFRQIDANGSGRFETRQGRADFEPQMSVSV